MRSLSGLHACVCGCVPFGSIFLICFGSIESCLSHFELDYNWTFAFMTNAFARNKTRISKQKNRKMTCFFGDISENSLSAKKTLRK